MGLIGLILWILHQTHVLHVIEDFFSDAVSCPVEEELLFEWIHFALFFFIVLYLIACLYLIFATYFISLNWKKYDELGYGI